MKTLSKAVIGLACAMIGMACSDGMNGAYGDLYRADIIGHWKLTEISTRYNYDNENTVTVDYSSNHITYDFRSDNKLIITGYVPDDLSEGEHSYAYTKPNPDSLSLPGPNLQIGNEALVFV